MGVRVWQNKEKDQAPSIKGIQFMYYNKPLPTSNPQGNEFISESIIESAGKSLDPDGKDKENQNYELAMMMEAQAQNEMNPVNFAQDSAFG